MVKSWHFGKIVAFDENHGFRDFRLPWFPCFHDFRVSM